MAGASFVGGGQAVIRRTDGAVAYAGPAGSLREALVAIHAADPFHPGERPWVEFLDLSGMTFRDQDLAGLDLRGCDLSGATVAGTIRVDRGGPGHEVRFPGAQGFRLHERTDAPHAAHLTDCDLTRANLSGADLGDWSFHTCRMPASRLDGASAACTLFRTCDMRGIHAPGLTAGHASFLDSDLGPDGETDANLSGAFLEGASLEDARLWRTNLSGVRAAGARLAGAKATKADFRRADLRSTDWSGADVRRCDLRLADLRNDLDANARAARGLEDRTFGARISGNLYGGEMTDAMSRMAELGEAGASLRARGVAANLRRVWDAAFENLSDASVPGFASDRIASMLAKFAGKAMTAGVGIAAAHAVMSYGSGHLVTGTLTGIVAYKATEFLSKAVGIGAKIAFGPAIDVVRDAAHDLAAGAVRRGRNLRDLVVALARGGDRRALLGALRVCKGPEGTLSSALAGDVQVIVCDGPTLFDGLRAMRRSVDSPELMPHDFLLLRDGGDEAAPRALRFHAGGGMTAIHVREGEVSTTTWDGHDVVDTQVLFMRRCIARGDPDVPQADITSGAEDCLAARSGFYRELLRANFGHVDDDAPVHEILVRLDAEGRTTARFDMGGPWVAAPAEGDDPAVEGLTLGMR